MAADRDGNRPIPRPAVGQEAREVQSATFGLAPSVDDVANHAWGAAAVEFPRQQLQRRWQACVKSTRNPRLPLIFIQALDACLSREVAAVEPAVVRGPRHWRLRQARGLQWSGRRIQAYASLCHVRCGIV